MKAIVDADKQYIGVELDEHHQTGHTGKFAKAYPLIPSSPYPLITQDGLHRQVRAGSCVTDPTLVFPYPLMSLNVPKFAHASPPVPPFLNHFSHPLTWLPYRLISLISLSDASPCLTLSSSFHLPILSPYLHTSTRSNRVQQGLSGTWHTIECSRDKEIRDKEIMGWG